MAKTYGFSPFIKEWLNRIEEDKKYIVKKEINRLLQIANRRAENIENSKIASPAYKALINELSDSRKLKFSKFSIGGLNLSNYAERVKAIDIYSRALAFVNNKTSSVIGAKQFINDIANQNKIPFTVANNLVDIITNPQITNGNIIINNWDSERITNMVSEYTQEYNGTVQSQEEYYRKVEENINSLFNKNDKQLFDIWDL